MSIWLRPTATQLWTWLGHLTSLLMLGMLAWLCAHLWWDWKTPTLTAAVIEPATDPGILAAEIARRHLFGEGIPAATQAGLEPSPAPGNLQLSGIIATQHGAHSAYALLSLDGQPAKVVRQGEEISPGLVLQRISPHEIELSRHGQRQRLSLPKPGTTQ